MHQLEEYLRCTICGQPQSGLNTIIGADVCDTCAEDGPSNRLAATRKLGTLDWQDTAGMRLGVEADGELRDGASSGVEAVFDRRGLGLLGWLGRLFGKKQPAGTEIEVGDDPDFNRLVRIETSTEEATVRFLSDAAARRAIATIVGGKGRVTIRGGQLHVEMAGMAGGGVGEARALYEDGLWSVGILFSRLAAFSGVDWPELTIEERNPYLAIRAGERAAWLARYAQQVAELLGGQKTGEDYDIALEIEGHVSGRDVKVELNTDEGWVELYVDVRDSPYDIGFGDDRHGNLLDSLRQVDLGNEMWAWAYHPHGPDEARATLEAMGSERVQRVTDLIRRRQVRTFKLMSDKFDLELQPTHTAPAVPPEEVLSLFEELAELASSLERG